MGFSDSSTSSTSSTTQGNLDSTWAEAGNMGGMKEEPNASGRKETWYSGFRWTGSE
ncbi:hypothetical protein ANO14919_088830 [Xylariales sp. No.14919]|nr:hypothetical protein ANO14919_088830 [Xylariales sp. No.14919]